MNDHEEINELLRDLSARLNSETNYPPIEDNQHEIINK